MRNTRDDREVARAPAAPLREARLYPTYSYRDPIATGRNKNNTDWDVPLHFALQTSGLYEGFRAWLVGYPGESTVVTTTNHEGGAVEVEVSTPVKPMRLPKNGRLPHNFKRAYDNNYRPVMEVLEDAVMDYDFLRTTYNKAFDAACVKYPEFVKGITKNWKVSTFCRKVREAKTEENKANGTKRITKKRKRDDLVV